MVVLIVRGTTGYPRGEREPSLSEKAETTPLISSHGPREASTLSPSLAVWESVAREHPELSASLKKQYSFPRLLDHADG